MLFSLCCSYEPNNAEVFFPTPAPRRKVFVGFVCACACMCCLSVLEMSFLMLNGMFYVAHEFHLNVFFYVLIRMFSFASSLFG